MKYVYKDETCQNYCTHTAAARIVGLQADTAVRRRSVALGSDPAMREMVHFVGSHEHDSRLKVGPGVFHQHLWVYPVYPQCWSHEASQTKGFLAPKK